MIDKLVERVAVVIAAKVVEELFERLPDPADLIVKVLPQIAEKITEEMLDRLPFPFKR